VKLAGAGSAFHDLISANHNIAAADGIFFIVLTIAEALNNG
jgi:hypothetical protein